MRGFKLATHLILLATTPSMLVYPQGSFHSPSIELSSSRKLHKNFRKRDRYHLLTYDQILKFLSDVESGKAEKKYKKDLDKVNDFLVYLAEEGALSGTNDALALSEDIADLLSEDEYEFAHGYGYALATLNS